MDPNFFSFFINNNVRVCNKKFKYPTKKDAIKARKQLISRRGDQGRVTRVFYCACCKAYHIGKAIKNMAYEKNDTDNEEQFVENCKKDAVQESTESPN